MDDLINLAIKGALFGVFVTLVIYLFKFINNDKS